MSNSNFSSLVYRIIGKPDRWHDDYIVEMMQQYLDEAGELDDPFYVSELAAGEQLLASLKQGNVALNAFNTLLDQSRFQMIILDEQMEFVYHNKNADRLFSFLTHPKNDRTIVPALAQQIKDVPIANSVNSNNALVALDFQDEHGDQIYMRSIQSKVRASSEPTYFHILMVLDDEHAHSQLNSELVTMYGFTSKEQRIVVRLIHGESIKEIAIDSFVSEHTVKSHLKSIFAKTGAKSQGSLISLILTHESQVLDSYFESDISTAVASSNGENDRELRLSGGQLISYCDYGPANGRPLIVFHSGFGSRLAIPPGYQEACKKHNRRVIVPDRPGLGKTPFIEGHPENWNSQLQEFIDILGIEEYDVLGSIIACQMAMSYVAQAGSRVNKLILASPVFLNTDEHASYLTEILAPAARYVKLSPQFAREIYELWLKSVTLNLDGHYPSILEESIGSAERELFDNENVVRLLTDVFKEGARHSLDGILNEMIFCMTPLKLDLSKFTTPVEVWYGTEDKRITEKGVSKIFSEFPNCKTQQLRLNL
jgi:pimeloyl-ACP methyl ester carboxylesterase/DNA-binding NarL/FixJ family response regulator